MLARQKYRKDSEDAKKCLEQRLCRLTYLRNVAERREVVLAPAVHQRHGHGRVDGRERLRPPDRLRPGGARRQGVHVPESAKALAVATHLVGTAAL